MPPTGPRSRRLRWIDAGHNPPVVLTPDGQVSRLEGTGLPLGMMPASTYESRSVALPTGSVAVFCTDGVIERLNRSGEPVRRREVGGLAPRVSRHDGTRLAAKVASAVETFARGTAPRIRAALE